MDIGTTISVGKSLLELGQEIGAVIAKAQESPDVTRRILLYLDSASTAVAALGIERQRILTDVRRCDVARVDEVSALWVRLDRYLHEDNIRPRLESSIRGLHVCRQRIEKEAKGAWWRKRDKQAAVAAFSNTLNELESVLTGLTSNFHPGGSGMGIQTLVPIFAAVTRVHGDNKLQLATAAKVESVHEEFGDLVAQALRDASHEEWFRVAGRVEALVAELQLAFSVKVTQAITDER